MRDEVVVGKYTLESLTNGMYADPLDLFREYIQNAVDSIDTAVEKQIGTLTDFIIEIFVDDLSGTIRIRDNACGVGTSKINRSLVDIGNSQKDKKKNRGFRGIGRLAGVGYCDELFFITSSFGEGTKTVLRYDTALLRKLMFSGDSELVSINDVMSEIITITKENENPDVHYFEVVMEGVKDKDRLLNIDAVEDYLIQHAPLPFSDAFHWGSTLCEKSKINGFIIPEYQISLNGKKLYKPYRNSFICDRVKKREDSIYDVEIKPFYRDGKLSAIMWYGVIGFYGTVLDPQIKGIRIRQGNILIGDKSTCNSLFKEERFNGWLVGELHVVDTELVVNARRDYFELNEAHYDLAEDFTEWSSVKTKDLRKISYERSLEEKKRRVVEAESFEDVNDLLTENMDIEISESDLIDKAESEEVAQTDFIDKLSWILNQKKCQTRYLALNINEQLNNEQRKTLEKVFDIVVREYQKPEADGFINTIATHF